MTKTSLKHKLFSEEGFTLVELMAIVAIISVLLTISYAVFNRSTQEVYRRESIQNVRMINKAIVRAALTEERTLVTIDSATTNKYLPGGLASLTCQVKDCPAGTSYKVVQGKISPAHLH